MWGPEHSRIPQLFTQQKEDFPHRPPPFLEAIMSTLLLACIATALVLFGPSPPTPPQYADYMKERAAMLAAEEAEWLGGGAASLTAEELKVSKRLAS